MHKPAPDDLDAHALLSIVSNNNFLEGREIHTYICTLETPMLGGGVIPGEFDKHMPVRATAIRGQLRFWWRLIMRKQYQNSHELFKAERKIWGGLGDTSTLASSKVNVRLYQFTNIGQPIEASTGQPGIKYALGPLAINKPKWLPAGMTWHMDVELCKLTEFTAEEKQSVLNAVHLWATMGGVGARTRRGFGAVRVCRKNDDHAISIESIPEEIRKNSVTIALGTAGYSQAEKAWEASMKVLQGIRQEVGDGRNGVSSKDPGRSYWPEPDAIRRITGRHENRHKPEHAAGNLFPRAAFGLPIAFRYHPNDKNEPRESELKPVNSDRMASPIIIRPYYDNDKKQWAPMAVRLPSGHVWEKKLELKIKGETNSRIIENWWPSANEPEVRYKALLTIRPFKDITNPKVNDPLTAFLTVFQKRTKA